MTKFSDLKLDPKVLQAVTEAGYETPTPIQQGAIPPALEGRDVLGIAQTGTGKTASFTLPMITLLGRGRARARMPRSLVLCPTRELAAQVAENFDTYAKHTRLTKALLIGGVSFGEQDKLIDRGVDVLIATPGRLLDHVERGKLLLTGVQIMVVDEADRMLDMGFIPDIERIFQLTPFTRQTLFFSATMAPEIERITNTFLHSPERIEVARQSSASETITQRLIELTPTRRDMAAKQKRDLLRALIDAEGEGLTNAIVFCNRKTDVDIVAKSLAKYGYDAAPIHGDLDQSQRTRTLESFRDGKLRLLIASDVAARGLDIPAVSHVFNYDLPSHAEDYVHRIGRTGRAGRTGTSISIATPSDEKYLTAIEQLLKKALPRAEAPAMAAAPRDARPEAEEERKPAASRERSRSRGRRRGGDDAEAASRSAPEPIRTEPARTEQPRTEQPRSEQPRPEPVRTEQPRREERRDDRRDDRRGDRRDGRRGRDGDNRGGAVMGMGDHVPQFMLVELRSAAPADDAATAETPEPAPDAKPDAAKPARRSRSRSRSRTQADAAQQDAAPQDVAQPEAAEAVTEAPAPQETAPTPVEATVPPVEEAVAEKPKRRRSRKTEDAPIAAEAEVAPKPTRRRKAAAPEAAAPEAPETEGDAPAEKPKRTRRKAAEPEAADAAPKPARRRKAAASEAEGDAAAEKPKRTRRKKAEAPAEDVVSDS